MIVKKFKNQLHYQEINFQEKIDNLICLSHRVSRSLDFDVWNDVNIKKFQKQCWKGKPVVKDIIDEVKLLFGTCVENSEPFTTFLQHFVEKAFDLACNVEKENFDGYEDGIICFKDTLQNLYENCAVPNFPNPTQIFEHGICQ